MKVIEWYIFLALKLTVLHIWFPHFKVLTFFFLIVFLVKCVKWGVWLPQAQDIYMFCSMK